jgi:hypothetical protein
MVIPFVIAIIIGLLFIYFVFFTKKEESCKEHMNSENKNMKIINYNTEWCGYSKRFQPTWDTFTQEMKTKHSDVEVIDMKCDKDENKDKCTVPEVEGFPTVCLYKDGKPIIYNESRTVEKLLKFVTDNKSK